MWIRLEANESFAVKIYADGINVIYGDSVCEDEETIIHKRERVLQEKSIRDYLVPPTQYWIDGVTTDDSTIQQFTPVPTDQTYSVECLLTKREGFTGLQFEIAPFRYESPECTDPPATPMDILKQEPKRKAYQIFIKSLTGKTYNMEAHWNDLVGDIGSFIEEIDGATSEDQRLIFAGRQLEFRKTLYESGIHSECTVHSVLAMRSRRSGEAVRGIPPLTEGSLKRLIARDMVWYEHWADVPPLTFNVQMLNLATFRSITGLEARRSPAAARRYDEAGRPFYESYEESSGPLNLINSVDPSKQEKSVDHREKSSKFPLVMLNEGSAKRFRFLSVLYAQLRGSENSKEATENKDEENAKDEEDVEDNDDNEDEDDDEGDEDDNDKSYEEEDNEDDKMEE